VSMDQRMTFRLSWWEQRSRIVFSHDVWSSGISRI